MKIAFKGKDVIIFTKNQFQAIAEFFLPFENETCGLHNITAYPKTGFLSFGSHFTWIQIKTVAMSRDFSLFRMSVNNAFTNKWLKFSRCLSGSHKHVALCVGDQKFTTIDVVSEMEMALACFVGGGRVYSEEYGFSMDFSCRLERKSPSEENKVRTEAHKHNRKDINDFLKILPDAIVESDNVIVTFFDEQEGVCINLSLHSASLD